MNIRGVLRVSSLKRGIRRDALLPPGNRSLSPSRGDLDKKPTGESRGKRLLFVQTLLALRSYGGATENGAAQKGRGSGSERTFQTGPKRMRRGDGDEEEERENERGYS